MTAFRRLAAVVVLALGIGAAGPATAATRADCLPREKMVAGLAAKYGEVRVAFALQSNKQMLEIYASQGGSWSAVVILPDGRACMVAYGEAWTLVTPVVPGADL